MVWLWSSYEEFKEYVMPAYRDNPRIARFIQRDSTFENLKKIYESVNAIENAISKLSEMGYTEDSPKENEEQLEKALRFVEKITYNGETLLLYHKRLAVSRWSYDFLHEKDLEGHWDRYASSRRIYRELGQFICAAKTLIDGFYELITNDETLLISDIDLPTHLMEDFILAHNLFSVGFDDVGALIAGRGLEGVLQEVSRLKNIKVQIKGKDVPICDASFYDLIEILYRVQWKKDKSRFIDKETKNLLHYLRDMRNSSAHPNLKNNLKRKTAHEIALITLRTAQSVWDEIKSKRGRFVNNTIVKDWS